MKINSTKIEYTNSSEKAMPKKNSAMSFQGSAPVNNEISAVTPQSYIGSSQINSRKPVSYTKIKEFSIPGVEGEAQLFKLSNGQRVVIVPKKGTTVVNTLFKTGGFNEPDNLRGISHFIEHNLFNGSERLKPREYDESVSNIGAYTNAYTSNSTTAYYIKTGLGRENLENLIKLNSEQVQYPTFPVEQLEKEKGIVNSEISMISDDESNYAHSTMIKNLFQISSTSDDLVAGRIQNINALTRDDLVKYYNTYYSPDNAITVIVGDVDPNETIDLVSKSYTKQPPQQAPEKNFEVLTPITSSQRTDIRKQNAIGASISLGFSGPQNNEPKEALATELMLNLLSGYKNSRLQQALKQVDTQASFVSERMGNKPTDNICISCDVNVPEDKTEKTLQIIYDEIAKFIQFPPSQEEFDISKRKMISGLKESNETSENLASFIQNCLIDDDTETLGNFENMINSLTLEDIVSAAKKYLDLNKASICVVHPQNSTDEAILNNYKNIHSGYNVSFGATIQPQTTTSGETAKGIFEGIKEYKLPNNVEVSVNSTNNDKCIFSTKYISPMLKDVSSLEFAILNQMLGEGSLFRADKELYDSLDKNDIEMSLNASPTGLSYSVKCPDDKLQDSFNALNEIMFYPRLTQEELDKAKSKVKAAIENMQQSPSDKLYKTMFPNLAFYETKEDMLKALPYISLEKIQSIYARLRQSSYTNTVLSAPIDKNPVLEQTFVSNIMANTGMQQEHRVVLDETYTPISQPQIVYTAEENAQANLVQAYKFKKTGNIDDDAKIKLLNIILGGGMRSRLFQDLRETQKLAYSVNSSYSGIGDSGIFALKISTTTNDKSDVNSSPENVTKSINAFNKHTKALCEQNVSEDELKCAKAVLKNEALSMIETNLEKTVGLADLKNNFYGKEYINKLIEAIDKVSADDIRACANYIFSNPPVLSLVASQSTLDALNLK